jgi:hypothetical protein
MPRPHGSSWGPNRVRRRARRGKSGSARARTAWRRCRGWASLLLAAATASGCAHAAPSASRLAPQPELARELESCGGTGPDSLQVTLVRIPNPPALRHAICDWFQDEPWRVRFRVFDGLPPGAPEPGAGELFVSITPSAASLAQLSVLAPARDPAAAPARWLEPVSLRSGWDEVGIEVIAQTLHSTAQASLSRAFPPDPPVATIVTTRAPRSVEEPEAPASEAVALPVHTALGYHFYVHGDEPVTHGPSLRLELDWLSRAVVLSSYVRTALFTSTEAHSEGVAIGLNGIGLGGGLAASLPWRRWTGRVGLGGNVDLLGLDVQVQDAEALRSLGSGRPRPRVFLTAEAGLAARLGRTEVGLAGLLRWQTSESHYEVLEGGQPHTIARAWRLQPGAALEVAYVW